MLLVAGEPLAIHFIKNILGLDAERVREGLDRLGGLIADDGQQRYWLFHSKLYDYLSQDEANPRKEYLFATDEEENWEKKLAEWCVQGGLAKLGEDAPHNSIEQDRRKYALRHYITHLYHAREWQQLFAVLDEGIYGRVKLRYDPSTRSYAQDLDFGRRAAASKKWTLSEGVQRIPNLWRYTLLRCSLSSRADQYPLVAFRLLVLLKRKHEALELAELLTDPAKKVSALLQIAEQMRVQEVQEQEGEWHDVRARAIEIVLALDDKEEQDKALRELATAFAQAQQWELAEAGTRMITGRLRRDEASVELGKALGKAQQWERAETVIGTIGYRLCRAEASLELWKALGQARQWERAETLIRKVDDEELRVQGLVELGAAFTQAQQWERADAVWTEVEGLTRTTHSSWVERVKGQLVKAFAQARQWERAEALISTISFSGNRASVLVDLGAAFAQVQQLERADAVWTEAEITDSYDI